MKNGCLKILLIAFVLLFIYYSMQEPPKDDIPIINLPNPKPDSTRKVYKFDWNKMQYTYLDELPKDTGTFYDHPAMPDLYVQTINDHRVIHPRQVLLEGKRYRVNIQPNGNAQLIPIR